MKRRILAFFVILVLAAFTIGVQIANHPSVDKWLEEIIVQQAREHLGVDLELGKLDRNIILTRLTLTDVTIRDLKGSGNSITVSRLVVSLDPFAFFRGRIAIRDLKLEGLSLDVVRREDGTVAIEPLFPFWEERGTGNRGSVKLGFEIQDVALTDVNLSYTDIPAGLKTNLREVVILLTRSRFGPPDRRTISLGAKKGNLAWKVFPQDRTVSINSLSGEMALTRDSLRISKLAIETDPLSLNLTGVLPFQSRGRLSGELSITLNLGKVPWLIGQSEGRVMIKGSIGGDLAAPSFRGQAEGVDVRVAGRLMNKIGADIYLDTRRCTLTDVKLQYKGESLVSNLDLEFKRGLPYDLKVRAQQYPLYKILEEVGGKSQLKGGYVSADLNVKGKLISGESHIAMKGVLDLPLGDKANRHLDFDLQGRYGKAAIHDLQLKASSESMDIRLAGKVSGKGPDLEISVTDDDLSGWYGVPGLENLSGSMALTGAVRGGWDSVAASFDLKILRPAMARFKGDLLKGHVEVDSKIFRLSGLIVQAGSSTLTGRATLPWDGGDRGSMVDLSINDGQISDLLNAFGVKFDASGKLGGSLHLTSDGSKWDGTGRLTLESGHILQEPYDEISASGGWSDGVFNFERLAVVKDGRRLEGAGVIKGNKYRVTVHTIDPVLLDGIQYLKLAKVPLKGEVNLTGNASGSLDGSGLRARADVAWDRVTFEGRPWRSGKGTFVFQGPELEARAELLDGELSAVANVDLRGDFPFSGNLRTTGTIDRAGINDFIGIGIPSDMVEGQISVQTEASGNLKDIRNTRIEGVISRADFTVNGISFQSRGRIPFEYFSETGIQFASLPLSSGGSVLDGSLHIAPDAGIEGSVDGSIDLTGLTFLAPTVDSFAGKAIVQLKVSGGLASPVLNGTIELKKAECVAHLPFDLPVNDLEGKLEIVGNRLHITEIRGRPESGRLLMSGDIFMSGFKPTQGSITWKAEGVPIHYPKGLDTVVRADIGLKFSQGRGFLRGTINMDQGVYQREVNVDNLLGLLGERSGKNGSLPGSNGNNDGGRWLSLDIEMITASPLRVDIKLLRGEASGNLHLRGTASAPVLTGRLEMSDGTIEYRGHNFEVTSGSVAFLNPKTIEPSFDFSAKTDVTGFDREGTVTDYSVELLATGVPEKFKLDLVSSPALSETDIVALLTWGAVGEKAFASRGGLSAAEATLLLTSELKGKLETEVEKVTGFDRFTINPSTISSSGERTTRIQVDKKLSDKFYLTYSTPILASEEQEVTVKYRITKSFSIVGEQLGESDYGLDLDFQFEIP